MSHLRRLINQNLLKTAKRSFGSDAHHAAAATGAKPVGTGGFAKDGSILFRNWEGKAVYGKPGEYRAIKFKKEEEKILYQVFKSEMFGAHPTKAFDRSAFIKYSPEQLAKMNAVPKYSRPVMTITGARQAPRVFWLFPLYFTIFVVGNTYMCELVDPQWWNIPISMIFPKKDAEAV